jgi:hypothetical protein
METATIWEYAHSTPASTPTATGTSTFAYASMFHRSWRYRSSAADQFAEAIKASAGSGASNVSAQTKANAQALLELLEKKPAPEIVVETSGEVSFEWDKDRYHVAVLSMQGAKIRWAGINGQGHSVSGEQPFDGTVPAEALTLVEAAI